MSALPSLTPCEYCATHEWQQSESRATALRYRIYERYRALRNASRHGRLKQVTQQITVAETTMHCPVGNVCIIERDGSWKMWNDLARNRSNQDGRTNGTQGLDDPHRTTAAQIECRGSNQLAACGLEVLDQSKDDRYCCKTGPDAGGCRTDDKPTNGTKQVILWHMIVN